MAAQYDESRRFDAQLPFIAEAVDGALRDIGAYAIDWSTDRQRVTAELHVNVWSWGERLDVEIDAAGEVHVRSTCVFPLQVFDWGKNRRNCHKLLAKTATRIQSEGYA